MIERSPNPEQHNPYQLTIQLSNNELRTMKRLAFVANSDNFTIIIGDRHERIMDGNNLSRQDYRGGDIWLDKDDITYTSASLGDVDEHDRDLVSDAIRQWMKTLPR